MTAVFADTSALLALLKASDTNHHRAARAFAALRTRQAWWTPLITMRQGKLEQAFAFDPDFEQEGFSLVR